MDPYAKFIDLCKNECMKDNICQACVYLNLSQYRHSCLYEDDCLSFDEAIQKLDIENVWKQWINWLKEQMNSWHQDQKIPIIENPIILLKNEGWMPLIETLRM